MLCEGWQWLIAIGVGIGLVIGLWGGAWLAREGGDDATR